MKFSFMLLVAVLLTAVPGSIRAAEPATQSEFRIGVDANYAVDMEHTGRKWSSPSGKSDPLAILAESGVTDFRIRLWTGDEGMNGLTYATETARRAHAAGMKPYLVIFLSDNWSDFVKAPVPAIWKDLPFEQRLAAIEQYSNRVTSHFREAGIPIDTYEIGNEIDFGICGEFEGDWAKRVSLEYCQQRLWPRMSEIILAAQRGVRRADPKAQFVLHLAQWQSADFCIAFWKFMLAKGVQLDVLGLSYFPTSAEKPEVRSFSSLNEQLQKIAVELRRPIWICEFAYPSRGQFTGQFAEWNKPVPDYALDEPGQARWLADFLKFARTEAKLAGVFYWSPEWYASDMWPAFALFDETGKPKTALGSLRPAGR